MHTFPDCIAHVLAAEGGLVNDPKDPGGVTKFGISQRSYPALDIRALSLDDAKAIYQRDYWDKIQGEALPAGLDLLLLDHAVNAGPARANTLLQGLITNQMTSSGSGDQGGRQRDPEVGGAGAALALRQGDIADGQHRPIVIEDGALALGVRQVGAHGLVEIRWPLTPVIPAGGFYGQVTGRSRKWR